MKNIGLVFAVAGLAMFAASAEAKVKYSAACKGDLEKFCKDIKKGGGRKACLRTHASELQADCTAALKEADETKVKK